ncbi:hypothetical protein [Pseudoalteromonas byunsanensis]|uniref:hypothetical protein n=1 Tax=Pseudoalteromonas byunsanensis TaxID=327939 RepID=UPI000B02DB4D|nr:hypothetical protein [Pseudoalteromonas byunsanensis]
MKIKLNKKSIKDLSTNKQLNEQQTVQVGGGYTAPWMCQHSYPVCYTSPGVC